VGEKEPTENYIRLVVAPQMGRGIVTNTVQQSREISFLKPGGQPCYFYLNKLIVSRQKSVLGFS